MDLSKWDTVKSAARGAKLELRNPGDGEIVRQDLKAGQEKGDPVTITLAGRDSPQWRQAATQQANRRIDEGAMGRRKISLDDIENDACEILGACTLGWEGIALDGETLSFSQENAVKLYHRLPWVREQVDAFISNRANFLKA